MGTSLSPHRRHFWKTTLVALAVLALIGAVEVADLVVAPWSALGDHTASGPERLAGLVGAVALALLAAYAALVVLGGLVILHRDACEDRGVPYAPARPRERIIGPMCAAIRRSMRPRAPLLPGEVVEVRSLPEILATLDENGCLDGLPFMPEMEVYCGHRFRVHRRIEKVWEYAHETGMRRMRGAVMLEGLRCGGQAHGGCQASCELIWKEAWLRVPGSASVITSSSGRGPELDSCTHVSVDGETRYVCQMTEIIRASTQISQRDPRHYWRDLVQGNVRLAPLMVALGVRSFNGANWRLNGSTWPVLTPLQSDASPQHVLGLQPGQLVRIRSKRAIEQTLNRQLRNRGLEFGKDMLSCSGGSHRVVAVVDRIVDERTGEMLEFKTPSVLLEGAHANGGSVLTPQNEFFFWREAWLEPHPAPVEAEDLR